MKALEHQIEVGNIIVDVVRKNVKNLNLRVYQSSGRVRMAVPLRIDDDTLRSFVISKMSWIKKHQSRFQGQEPQPQHEFLSGESHYYCGKPYPLNVIFQDSRPRVEFCNNDQMDLYVRPGSDRAKREKVMIEWYRSKLKEEIPDLIEKWQWVIGVQIHDWRIKKMKTRWGSCNRKTKRIWLNLELAKKPLNCLEFIIVHELTHLIERRHNKILALRYCLWVTSFFVVLSRRSVSGREFHPGGNADARYRPFSNGSWLVSTMAGGALYV